MRAFLTGLMIAIVIGVAGSAAHAATSNLLAPATTPLAMTPRADTDAVRVSQRCRCVERRWNGSCKLRVCRDRW